MNNSVDTVGPRYGLHLPHDLQPKPWVYRSLGGGYQIIPVLPGIRPGAASDDLEYVIQDLMMPGWVAILRWLLFAMPLIGVPFWLLTDRHYERQFWVRNGFDPDSFS